MMTAEKSMMAFGAYLVPTGAALALAPAWILLPLGLPAPQEVWVRVLGLVVLALAAYYIQAARQEMRGFAEASVPVRMVVAAGFAALVLAGGWPPVLLLFGAVDLMGALWTRRLLADRTPSATQRSLRAPGPP